MTRLRPSRQAMPGLRLVLLLVCGMAGGAASAQVPARPAAQVAGGTVDHEQQLQAIRQALVDATLGGSIRVQSTAWLDGEGRLHEESQFTSDAQVRGVRVLSYLEDPVVPGQAPKVKVDVDVLPPSVRPGAGNDPAICLARQGRWRQGLHVEVHAAAGLEHGTAGTQALLARAREAFLEASRQSRRWAARPRPHQPATAYERLLVGRETDLSDWLARLTVRRGRDGVEAALQLTPLHGAGVPVNLTLPIQPGGEGDPAAWQRIAGQWIAALDQQTACEPVWFGVAQRGGAWQLREGEAHGLRPGDRLLVVERQHLSGRLLEPGAAPALAMLQVASISASGTSLRWLAGPRPPAAGDWVALPL